MFTPQKRAWWFSPHRSENKKSRVSNLNSNSKIDDGSVGKGKNVASLDATTPPSGSLYVDDRELEAEERDEENLAEKVSKLENELFNCQYNMGLLVMEKKEWTCKYEDSQKELTETKDALKREQGAHLIAMADVEKREENLRKALGIEKQCVLDLEKTLREMRAEYAEIKFTADSKLGEANSLAAVTEEKSLEVESKLHVADAKLAEASRKSAEVERRLQELETRESSLRRERLSFSLEREAHEVTLSKRREDLQEWERKLHDREERLGEARGALNQREERLNENDRSFNLKKKDLEEAQKKIDAANMELSKKEDDINSRLASLRANEKEADSLKSKIQEKEKELLALEEKLNEREMTGIQKLLDEHKIELESKRQHFEQEMDLKRKNLDVEMRSKVAEVEKKEVEVNHLEEKLRKREAALEKKLEKFKEKEKDFELKSRALKDTERSVKSEEKVLMTEKKEMQIEKCSLLDLKAELEQRRADIEQQLLKIQQEREQLKITEEDRSEHLRLQSALKQEIDNCRLQKELLLKEADELKQQRESFEREWEALDEKKAEIEKEFNNMIEEKEKLQKWKISEQERLRNENLSARNYIEIELEALKLAKDSFAADMEHERSVLSERAHSERIQMLNDFEMRKRELEIEMHKKLEEMEKNLHERVRLFEEEREKELNNIDYLREVAGRAMEDMKEERRRIEKQTQEVAANKKDLEGRRLEIHKDIEELVLLSSKLKEQRELFCRERERFIAFVDKNQSCENCGESTRAFVVSDLQFLHNMEKSRILPHSEMVEDYIISGAKHALTPSETTPGAGGVKSPKSGGAISWLRKCSSKIKVFNFSPSKQVEHSALQNLAGECSLVDQSADLEPATDRFDDPQALRELSLGVVNNSLDVQRLQPDDSVKKVQGNGLAEAEVNINDDEQEDFEALEHSGFSNPREVSKKGRRKITRTRSVQHVVSDAKTILGDAMGQNESRHPNGYAEESDESSFTVKGNKRNGRKRSHAYPSPATTSEQDGDGSEGRSDSVITGGRRKRRQKVDLDMKAPTTKRYNLRRPRNVATVTPAGTSSDFNKGKNRALGSRGSMLDANSFSKADAAHSAGLRSENGRSINLVQDEGAAETNGVDATPTNNHIENNSLLSEEVNGTPDVQQEYSYKTPVRDDHDLGEEVKEDDDEDGQDPEHPGQMSIGRRVWNFLTT
ncbi:hypothetical protein Nepgr_020872 [Nepenthes gracilis]|uniref:Nuclear matrix constituent protein 1-like protein n=1 Tax=Nepenthes gracilis TaxID=150966 RepID=A0AAD3SY21_NEPGR|nr:hypothetical protein Nepgr_020872 [Nepenthes gracilis]